MSTLVARRDRSSASPGRRPRPVTKGVVLAALMVTVLRLPFVAAPLQIDESGFLEVAKQWRSGGSSLYGDFWVDRPPLLVSIFRLAALLGDAVPLRLLGILAAVVAVLSVGWAGERLTGARGGSVAALVAAAFLASPLVGASEVNGELLAAPFVAVGMAAGIEALTARRATRTFAAAAVSGGAGMAAVLVKQNMLDVFVFGAVLALLLTLTRARGWGRWRSVTAGAAGFVVGASTCAVALVIWTLWHGTSVRGVWFAMYEFRLQANEFMRTRPDVAATERGQTLLLASVLSGMALAACLVAMLVLPGAARRAGAPSAPFRTRLVTTALAVTVVYDVVSIYLGGNAWSHYLVQLAVPLALAVGLASVRLPVPAGVVTALVLVSSLVVVALVLPHSGAPTGDRLGRAIGRAAGPTDTIVTVWGHSDVTHAAGLSCPYPYLWSLPALVLDPRASRLRSTLSGPAAPTWFVEWSGTPGLQDAAAMGLVRALRADYRLVAVLEGHAVYLHKGVDRPVPALG